MHRVVINIFLNVFGCHTESFLIEEEEEERNRLYFGVIL